MSRRVGGPLEVRRGVTALGICSWDRILVTDRYPGPGEYAIVREQLEQAGGTTGNTSDSLARLGVNVMVVSVVGNDAAGHLLIESLSDSGCHVEHIARRESEPTDASVIIVAGLDEARDRTIYWIQGARPRTGDTLPIDEMLEREWVLVDIDDPRLRNFILDLPAHRSPRTKLFGTMTFLVEMAPEEGWQHALRHDVVAGNERELLALTRSASLDEATARARLDLRFAACRTIYVSRGREGGIAIRADVVTAIPAFEVDVRDTTGAGDAFVAGCLWGLLSRCDDSEILRRANALGGLACRALGARAALPDRDEVERLLRDGRAIA